MASAFVGKLRGDLRSLLGRLVVLGLAVGVGVLVLTTITSTASTFLREMGRSYESTNPASATLEFDDTIDRVPAGLTGVQTARLGDSHLLRFLDGEGRWQPMVLFVVPDWAPDRIATVFPQPDTPWPPQTGVPAVERTALTTFGLHAGQRLSLRLPNGRSLTTEPLSVVHDPAVAPAYQERTAYATIDATTALAWGLTPFHQLKVRFDPKLSWAEVRQAALNVARNLGPGPQVTAIDVPPVHQHPHQGILVTLLSILGAFGVLTVVLCSLLVSNVIAALIARERRWIGVMKTLGASPQRIAVLFLAPVLVLGTIAVVWSVPLGVFASGGLTQALGSLLNIRVLDTGIDTGAWLLPAACGLVVPLLLALIPVRRALRLTILEAVSDGETERRVFVPQPRSRLAHHLPPALVLAWRNAGRKKRRLALSLVLLGVGGGLFLTGFNLSGSWKALIAQSLAGRKMTAQVRLVGPQTGLEGLVPRLAAGTRVEVWTSLPATTLSDGSVPVEATYPDEAHGSFRVVAIPETQMMAFPVLRGRGQPHVGEVVLNQTALVRFPGAEVGAPLRLVAGGREWTFTLAGVVQEVGQAAAYVSEGALNLVSGHPDFRTELVVASPPGDKAVVEAWLEATHRPVEVFLDNTEYQIAGTEHFGLLITILLLTGLITGFVGWLGVASLLGLAVVERRREFGILRSIGATPGDLKWGLVGEAVVMTLLGTVVALLFSYPLSAGMGAFLGGLSLKMPIPVTLDVTAALLWLALSLVAGVVASLNAGAQAARITIRETLSLT